MCSSDLFPSHDSEEELDWDSDDGIELREGLGRYWPEDDEVEA